MTFSPREFEGFRHDYAGTIYKEQGKTLDRTHPYHTKHWWLAALISRLSLATSQNPN